jgi:hypothetical protein
MTRTMSIILRTAAVSCCAVTLLLCLGHFSDARAGEGLTGKAVFLVTPSTRIPLGAIDDDHVVVHAAERGTRMEFSGAEFLKDCSLLRTSTCDLVRGRGSCFGYYIFESSDGDRLLAKYSGVRLPDTNQDKKPPEDVLRGTWVFVKGSGKFASIKGGGSYRGHYLSATEYALEWNGELIRAPEGSATNLSTEGR